MEIGKRHGSAFERCNARATGSAVLSMRVIGMIGLSNGALRGGDVNMVENFAPHQRS